MLEGFAEWFKLVSLGTLGAVTLLAPWIYVLAIYVD